MMLTLFISICYIFLTLNNASVTAELITVDDSNWSDILQGEWMIEFYAPWCPACQSLKPSWNEFAGWSKDLDIKVGVADITTSPVLTGRCLITALPTIFHVKDGEFRQFKGSRKVKDFLDFVEEKQWESVEPISPWQSPGSIQMGILGYFFKISYVMKDYHKILTEDYKFSTWVSYAFFTSVTILVGGLLGLVAVLILDAYHHSRQKKEEAKAKEKAEEDKKDK
jgi:thiol-disulfide isomerase/thioredoxin